MPLAAIEISIVWLMKVPLHNPRTATFSMSCIVCILLLCTNRGMIIAIRRTARAAMFFGVMLFGMPACSSGILSAYCFAAYASPLLAFSLTASDENVAPLTASTSISAASLMPFPIQLSVIVTAFFQNPGVSSFGNATTLVTFPSET